MPKFRIRKAWSKDVFADVVRIPTRYRRDPEGQVIPAGTVISIQVTRGARTLAVARGTAPTNQPVIRIDGLLRERLGVRVGEDVELDLVPAGAFRAWLWAWTASDPQYRIPSRATIISVGLGLVSVLLGILALILAL